MATCPKGHDSATADYCDVCGAPITGAAGPSAAPASPAASAPAAGAGPEPTPAEQPAPGKPCPVCGTAQTGRFCEEDGYDFLLAPSVEQKTGDGTAASPLAVGESAPTVAPTSGTSGAWQVVVGADQAYFEVIMAIGGADAGTLAFPRFVAERRFPLDKAQLLIGRRSRSRGVHPDIDLAGPPEDPGVSHLHALLVPEQGGWAVVDLDSANGTYLNDPSSSPIESNTPVPVVDGDRIYLGAWTSLTIRNST